MADPHTTSSIPTPAFLSVDNRVPSVLRELVQEADGCQTMNFLTGGTVCAQRAIHTLLAVEGAEGSSYEARLHSLSQKYPSVPQALFALCIRLGESPVRGGEQPRLDAERLNLLTVALKIMLYEIYVLGPDRADRLKYLQQLLEASEASAGSGRPSTVVAFPNA
jgi:hypothetical protein